MSDQITVHVEGIKKTISNLKKWQIIKRQAIENVLKQMGAKIEGDAKREITLRRAVDTGRLRASITHNWSGSSIGRAKITGGSRDPRNPSKSDDGIAAPSGQKGLVVAVGSNVHYAPHIEFGTNKMSARHYLLPAYKGNEKEVKTRIAKIMGQDERI